MSDEREECKHLWALSQRGVRTCCHCGKQQDVVGMLLALTIGSGDDDFEDEPR